MWVLWKQNKENMTRKFSETKAAYFWIDDVINRTDRLALAAR